MGTIGIYPGSARNAHGENLWGPLVNAQNEQRANKNAERLHGARFTSCGCTVQYVSCIPYMTNNKSKVSVRKSPAGGRSSRQLSKSQFQSIAGAGVAYSTQMVNSKPTFVNTKDGLRIVHREYVGDVNTNTSGFAVVNTLQINPGLSGVFPWLSLIAANFEVYEFHRLKFVYQAAAPTSQAGTLFMAIDYDAADSAPANKAELMSNMTAVSSSIWASNSINYDCAMRQYMSNRFTRNASLTNVDIKTYDAGNLYLAIEGAATVSPGNIYVEYDVSLRIPQIPSNLEAAASLKITNAGTSQLSYLNDGYTGNTDLINSLTGTIAHADWLCPSVGEYLLTYAIQGTSSSTAAPTWSVQSGSATIADIGYAILGATGVGIYESVLNVLDSGATIRLALTNITGITNYSLRVAKYGYSLA